MHEPLASNRFRVGMLLRQRSKSDHIGRNAVFWQVTELKSRRRVKLLCVASNQFVHAGRGPRPTDTWVVDEHMLATPWWSIVAGNDGHEL